MMIVGRAASLLLLGLLVAPVRGRWRCDRGARPARGAGRNGGLCIDLPSDHHLGVHLCGS